MSIAIYDKVSGSGSFEENARSAAKETMSGEDVPELNLGINDAATELCNHRLVVGHLSDEQWNALLNGPLDVVNLIIRVSSVGASGMSDCRAPYRLPDGGPWILHLREPSREVTRARWVEIFKALEGLDRRKIDVSKDVASIFDPNPESPLALRLLCEAYAMPTDETGRRNYQPKDGGAKPIPVHCPDPSTWFDLLGALKPGDENDEAAIAAFGRLMRDAEEDAKNLARAIVRGDSDISDPAGKFADTVGKITTANLGGAQ